MQRGQRENPRLSSSGELPASLDFFKYAKGGIQQNQSEAEKPPQESSPQNTQRPPSKKRKRNVDDSDNASEPSPSKLRHRVTTKGEHVPAREETFAEMQKRFSIAGNIMKNLEACGYSEPTAVQSVGIPILAEVCTMSSSRRALLLTHYRAATSQQYHQLGRERLLRICFPFLPD